MRGREGVEKRERGKKRLSSLSFPSLSNGTFVFLCRLASLARSFLRLCLSPSLFHPSNPSPPGRDTQQLCARERGEKAAVRERAQGRREREEERGRTIGLSRAVEERDEARRSKFLALFSPVRPRRPPSYPAIGIGHVLLLLLRLSLWGSTEVATTCGLWTKAPAFVLPSLEENGKAREIEKELVRFCLLRSLACFSLSLSLSSTFTLLFDH